MAQEGYRDELRRFVQRTMCPTVMVLPTGPAEAITRKSELSFVDLLRPCADVDTSGVAVNTTREQPYRVPQLTSSSKG
ncbi:hypothetical protein T484DRAFT_1786085 [Baffinella frigidus]|nr:hypothetical protein T484DRAFT_1786085 [Cryptophyta sp. CCMP2293]